MKTRNKLTGHFEPQNITKECVYCGKDFPVKEVNLERSKYCSRKCSNMARRGVHLNKETIEKIVKANTGKKRSLDFRIATSLRQLGSNNSRWNGGWTKNIEGVKKYKETRRYGMTKDEWIEYFGGKCALCGMTNYEHLQKTGIRLSIHHKDKRGRNTKYPNNDPENLMLLCSMCHGKLHLDPKRARSMWRLSI